MLILSLDCASTFCGVCIWRDGEILVVAEEHMERGQDQRLMPLALDMMKQVGVTFDMLDRIAVVRGPGSFTGIRIGLATARGISMASNKPVIGIDRFMICREQIKTPGKNMLAVINSKRLELFCRFYPANKEDREPSMMTPDQIRIFLKGQGETVIAGDVSLESDAVYMAPTEKDSITCSVLASRATVGDQNFLPRPLYIREPDVTFPRQATGA